MVPGWAHHITQRGNNRQDVFFVDDDRRVYLEMLQEQAGKYGLELSGYCLMSNHVHLIATPHTEDALAKAIGRTHFRYTQYVNRLHKRSGHLWQGRFYSCALDERQLPEQAGNPARPPRPFPAGRQAKKGAETSKKADTAEAQTGIIRRRSRP